MNNFCDSSGRSALYCADRVMVQPGNIRFIAKRFLGGWMPVTVKGAELVQVS